MRSLLIVSAALLSLVLDTASAKDETRIKFSECPPAVRSTFLAESKNAKIESVVREVSDDDEMVYWADVALGGKTYAVGVLENGTLSEINLSLGDRELPFDRCTAAAKETFQKEAFGAKLDVVERDTKYGVAIYAAEVQHNGKTYQIEIAEDGTLVEKALVIEEDAVELAKCPAAVQAAFHKYAKGGKIRDVTRSSGIGKSTYEAEVGVKNKVYLVEIDESGALVAMSLEASDE